MTSLNIDIHSGFLFLDLGIFRLLTKRLIDGEAPFPPHPRDHRWGITRDDGEMILYLGDLLVIFTPRSAVLRERRQISGR